MTNVSLSMLSKAHNKCIENLVTYYSQMEG